MTPSVLLSPTDHFAIQHNGGEIRRLDNPCGTGAQSTTNPRPHATSCCRSHSRFAIFLLLLLLLLLMLLLLLLMLLLLMPRHEGVAVARPGSRRFGSIIWYER